MRPCSSSAEMRISPTPRSSSALVTDGAHPFAVDDPRNGDHLVAAHDQRPAFTVGARDLGVDEHVLDLLRAAREPVARPPASYLKPWELCRDAPRSPAHLAVELDRPLLEPKALVLAHRLDPTAEVDALRADGCVEQLCEGARQCAAFLERTEDVGARTGMQSLEERQQLIADQAAFRVPIRRVGAEGERARVAVGLGLLAPEREQRTDNAVFAARLDSLRVAARREAKEDRLDLVARGVTRRAQPIGCERVAQLAQLVLAGAQGRDADDLGAELLDAETRVRIRLLTPQTVVDMQGGDAVAELPQRTPEAGRVGAPAHQAEHLSARLDQLMPADVLLDAPQHVQGHSVAVTRSAHRPTPRARRPPAPARAR